MTIYITHPATGTVLDLSECVVVTDPQKARAAVAATANKEVASSIGHRTYLLAVAEKGVWDTGTHREAVVLNTDDNGSRTLVLSGGPIKHYDDIHDLFVDIF